MAKITSMETKQCSVCGKFLRPEEFYMNRNGRMGRCKICHNRIKCYMEQGDEAKAKRKAKRQELKVDNGWTLIGDLGWCQSTGPRSTYIRDGRKIVNYSLAELADKVGSCDNRCAICGVTGHVGKYVSGELSLFLDHNHITGRLRGVLCKNCNLGISAFGYDTKKAQVALDYLVKNDSNYRGLQMPTLGAEPEYMI